MASVFTTFRMLFDPRAGVPPRGAARQPATSIVLVLMLGLLVVVGLANAFTELFVG